MVIIRRVKELKEYDVKEAYGTNAEGVRIRWISEKRTGGEKISGEIPELVEKLTSTILELKLIK